MYHITINIRATSTIYTVTMEYLDKGGTLHTKTLQGGVKSTANQNALQAAIDAVSILKGICLIEIHTDNDYLAGAVRNGWLKSWQENGWKSARGGAVKHQDKWQQLAALMTRHTVRFTKL